MKRKNQSVIKMNRKGDISLYFVLFAVLIFAITFLIYMGKMEGNLQKVGENTVKVINTFETSERLLFYMDASTEIAANKAEKTIIKDSGYSQERFKGKILNSGCGILAYPIIDSDKTTNSPKGINECFPNYEDEFKIIFTRNLNNLMLNYDPLKLDPSNFEVAIKKENKDLKIKVSALSDMNLPVYSYIESYYKDADRTKSSKETPNTIKTTTDGYLTMNSYLILNSFNRMGTTPTKIIIHDTKTSSVQETFVELQTGLKNYNYVIDQKGEIYQFASETKYTKNSGCIKVGTQNTCIIDNSDKESISIALVNKHLSSKHTPNQINSLIKLMAEITLRNPTIDLNDGSILLNSEIDSSRINDPAQDLASAKADIISKAITERDNQVLNLATSTISDSDAAVAGAELTGNVVAPIDVNEASCFNNIITTIYYTPDLADHNNIWSTNAAPCPSSSGGYCCINKENRGFYEDVMCQGSGFAEGRVYHYTKISQAGLSQSTPLPLEDFKRGSTSRQKDPVPQRTVAADPNCPGFNYGSKLYIYWGENNPWNGYYVVEDTGGAFKGRCDKMDIYAGVGKVALENAAKYVNDNGKVCVLDKNFQMPDLDFAGSSTFVDPTTGEYKVPYSHEVSINGLGLLFDNTKQLLDEMIINCGRIPGGAQKETCIISEMQGAETKYNLNSKYCDERVKEKIWTTAEVSNDMPLVVTQFKKSYKIMGEVKQVSANNVDLFAELIPISQQEQTEQGQQILQPSANTKLSPLTAFIQKPEEAIITVSDESGTELKITLTGEATDWIDYYNGDNLLFESNLFLRPGRKLMMNVTRVLNSTFDGYIITKFDAIKEYPKEILDEEMIKLAKTIGECATSKTACICISEASRTLGLVNMTGTELMSVSNEEVIISVPFTSLQSFVVDTSTQQKFKMESNIITAVTANEEGILSQCIPTKSYKYICSALKDYEELGTIGYALKI